MPQQTNTDRRRWMQRVAAGAAGLAIVPLARAGLHDEDIPENPRRAAILVTEDNESRQGFILNTTKNLVSHYDGLIEVEVICFGPGLSLLFEESTLRERTQALQAMGVGLQACANSMKAQGRTTDDLLPGATVVVSGIVHAFEREQAGWSVIRP